MDKETNEKDALIAHNTQTGESGVVTGTNADGSPQMQDPAKASKFMTFDRRADIIDNFLRNFAEQFKNPSIYRFFKVPADQVPTVGFAVNQMVQNPDSTAAKDMLAGCEVKVSEGNGRKETKAEAKTQEQSAAEQPQRYQPIDENRINWTELDAKWGIKREVLEQNGDLQNMLHNRMSGLVKVTPTFGNEKFELEARLAFKEGPDGNIRVVPHFIRQEPNLNEEFMGAKFTKEDKEMLKSTGNLGRVIELTDEKGNKIPSFVSIDRKTNELMAVPAGSIYIRKEIGDSELTPKELAMLREGKQVSREVTLKNGKTFPTVLQISASEQKAEFVPVQCRLNWQEKQKQSESVGQKQGTNWIDAEGKIKPIGKWKGVEFTDQQKADYVAGKTVKLENVPDAKGQPAALYIRFNAEKGRPYTYSSDPDKAKVITPAEESKSQVAVNNDGKTQESTKHLKDPLEKGQTQPKPEQSSRIASGETRKNQKSGPKL